ncbi:MAG: heme-binding domain-containing protein [bacterium]
MMKKILKLTALALAVLFVAIQFAGPEKTNPPVDAAKTIQANTQITPEVAAIIQRACGDCHSHQTQWPLYSYVEPVSWFLVDHVNDGRKHLNFSEWASYEPKRMRKKLQEMFEEVEKGAMPLKSYLLLHPDARLSQDDIQQLGAWAEAERRRLADENNLAKE